MIQLEPKPDGIVFAVRVQPGARRNGITGIHGGALKVAVTAVAEKGKANTATIEALCEAFNLRPRQLELIAGPASRQKRFLLRGLTLEELNERISQAIKRT